MSLKNQIVLFILLSVSLNGCLNVQPENPYDPSAPLSVQFKGKVKGRLHIQDFEITDSYLLTLLNDENIPVVDDTGEMILIRTRSEENLDSMDEQSESSLSGGSFEIQLESGTYSLLFDPIVNSTPQFLREQSAPIVVRPGREYQLDLYVQTVTDLSRFECLRDSGCSLGSICVEGVCVNDINADRDQDGIPDAADNCPSDENPGQSNNDSDSIGDVCDLDDDNDGVPDSIDNCPLISNLLQGNANPDDVSPENPNGIGNACDPTVKGISVIGTLDFSELAGADHTLAQIYLSGLPVQGINREGLFRFDQAIAEPGTYLLRVLWPGFTPYIQEITVPDQVVEFDLGMLRLEVAIEPEELVSIAGSIKLEGRASYADVVVRSRVGGSLVQTTLSDQSGLYTMALPKVDQTLEFTKNGYLPLELDLVYQTQGEHVGTLTYNDTPIGQINDLELTRLTGRLNVQVNTFPLWIPESQRQSTVIVIGENIERSVLAQDSVVTLNDLPSGDYFVFVERAGFSEARQNFTLNNEITEVSLELDIHLTTMREARLNISNLTLSGDDLREVVDLRGADLAGVNLTQADLCNLDLSGASLIGANLEAAKLSGANLSNARLDNAMLNRAELHGTDFTNVNLFGASLDEARFHQSTYTCQGDTFESDRTRLIGSSFASSSLVSAVFVEDTGGLDIFSCEHPAESGPIIANVYWNQTDLSRASLRGVDFKDSVFTSVNFSESHLEYSCFRNSNLLRVNFESAHLDASDFSYVNAFDSLFIDTIAPGIILEEANLSGVNLTRTNLTGIEAQKVSFSSVIFQDVAMDYGDLTHSDFIGNLLQGVNFSFSDLSDSDLRNIQVIDSTFEETNLSRSDLQNSDLSSADLSGCNLSDSVLIGANLGRVNLESSRLLGSTLLETNLRLSRYNADTEWPTDFDPTVQEALGPNTQLEGFLFPNDFVATHVQLQEANLRGARLDGVNLSYANLDDADLTLSTVNRTRFNGASLQRTILNELIINDEGSGVDFSEANLSGSELKDADLDDVIFTQADLTGADLTGSILSNSAFIQSQLRDAKFQNTYLDGSVFTGSQLSLSDHNWSDVSLRDSNLDGVDISSLDFRGADLSNTSMVGAILRETHFEDVELAGVNLSQATLQATALSKLKSCPGVLPNHQDAFVDYDDYTCRYDQDTDSYFLLGPHLKLQDFIANQSFENLNLEGCDLSTTRFKNVQTQGLLACPLLLPQLDKSLCLDGPEQRKTLLASGVIIEDADFSDLDLSGLDLHGAILRRVDFSDSDLTQTNLAGVDLVGSVFTTQGNTVYFNKNTLCPGGELQVDQEYCGTLFESAPELLLRDCEGSIPNCPSFEWIRVASSDPGVPFRYGSDSSMFARPAQTTDYVNGFEMMKTEVTVGLYRRCVSAGVCTEPSISPDQAAQATWLLDNDDYPINLISWQQAQNFAQWVNFRLPTEVEWEFAASDRGTTVHTPWEASNAVVTCDYAVIGYGCYSEGEVVELQHPLEVCSKPLGNTALGLCDIVGNVGEMTQTNYASYAVPEAVTPQGCLDTDTCVRVVRGSDYSDTSVSNSYLFYNSNLHSIFNRAWVEIDERSPNTGFRLVRDLPPSE